MQRVVENDILFTAYWYADATGRQLDATIDALDGTLQEWGLTEPDP